MTAQTCMKSTRHREEIRFVSDYDSLQHISSLAPGQAQLMMHLLSPQTDLSVNEMIKIDASTSDQPCASFGVNKHLGQDFVDLYNEGEMIFAASKCMR